MALEAINTAIPATVGGSADLTGSNNTKTAATKPLSPTDYSGRYIHYGIREHAMAAAMNGMALHGGVIPYSGTFLVFSDYSRPAIRLGALRRCAPKRPSHPAPNVRDDWPKRPSLWSGMSGDKRIFLKNGSKIFCLAEMVRRSD